MEMGSLSEVVTLVDLTRASPFPESIILATIFGRTLYHRQQSVVEHVYSHVPQQVWERHEWLYTILKTRHDNLLLQYPLEMQHTNCMLLFTNMMAQSTILYLCRVIESIPSGMDEYRGAIFDFKQKALAAAKEIVHLTRSLSHLSYFKVNTISFLSIFCLPFSSFPSPPPPPLPPSSLLPSPFVVHHGKLNKVHPFTPLPLALCVDFLNTHRYLDESIELEVEEILEALREMTNVNNLARDYLA